MRVSVLGTGTMGAAVTRTLRRNGYEVTVWNRTREKADALEGSGAQVAGTPGQAVQSAEVVLLTLYDADAVLEVMEQAVDSAPADAVWLQASTIGLEGTARAGALAVAHGVAMLDAMMLGTNAPAEQGELTLFVAGDNALAEKVRPVFDAISSKVLWVSPVVGQATALKLATNAWAGAITAATAQSVALAEGLGLEGGLFLEAIKGAPVDSAYAHIKGEAMISSNFAPSFTVDGVVKDLDLMIAAAEAAGVEDTLLGTVRSLFAAASTDGHGADDIAAVVTAFSAPPGG